MVVSIRLSSFNLENLNHQSEQTQEKQNDEMKKKMINFLNDNDLK